jgi:hypothetical protein
VANAAGAGANAAGHVAVGLRRSLRVKEYGNYRWDNRRRREQEIEKAYPIGNPGE